MVAAVGMTIRRKIRLGELLVQNGVISEQQLANALTEQRRTGRKLGRILRDLELLNDAQLHQFLSKHLQVPFVDLQQIRIDREAVTLLPEPLARRCRALVLQQDDQGLLLAMPDPTDVQAYDELKAKLKRPLRVALVGETDFLRTLETVYRRTEEIAPLAEAERGEPPDGEFDLDRLEAEQGSPDAPALSLLQSIFQEAVRAGASHIHLEPAQQQLRLRLRIDGVLKERLIEGRRVASALAARLKLMGGLDSADKRLAQEGRFTVRVGELAIEVRIASLPSTGGESLVMRLLEPPAAPPALDRLGMPPAIEQRFRQLLQASSGMVLVTGPPGCGSTSTLYAAIQHLNRPGIKVITIEEPVEYRLDGITQVPVQTRNGLEFARALRTALHQDPDILLIGELRDREILEIALQSAISGQLVFSTLPAIGAVAAINRLLDLGAPGSLIAAAVQGVIAQRRVRQVCPECARPAAPSAEQLAWLLRCRPKCAVEAARFVAGAGCSGCNRSGYRGHVALYELLEIDRALADAIRRGDRDGFGSAALGRKAYVPLSQSAIELALTGTTSLAEAMAAGSSLEEVSEPDPERALPGVSVEALLRQPA